MTTTQTQLFPPPTRSNVVDVKGMLAASFRQWLFSLQYLLPLVEVDTSAGNTILALPPAGLNANTGQSNQNQEIIYVKTSADGNTVSITGAETGAIILRKQWDSARFKSDGTNWINSGVGSSSGPGAASFALLTSGENNEAAMVVGHGASLTRDADGLIDASEIGGIKIPPGSAPTTVGKVPISQGDGTAAWADPLVQGAFAPGTNADTGNGGAPINPVLGGARRTTDAELQDLSCDAANNLNVNVQASALPAGAATDANQTNGSQKSQVVDGAGNVQPAGDTPARSIQVEQTDGANVIGTAAHPTRVDPTGTTTQPVSAAALPLPTNAAQEAGGNLAALAGTISGGKVAVSQNIPVASFASDSPAPGVEVSITIPAGTYRIRTMLFRLNPDTTVANRVPDFIINDAAGTRIYDVQSRFNQGASTPVIYQLFPTSIFDLALPATEVAILPIPPDLIVQGGAKISTGTPGIQPGDQWVDARVYLESVVSG